VSSNFEIKVESGSLNLHRF